MQVWRNGLMLQRQNNFDGAGDACAGLQVTNIRFNRTNQQGLLEDIAQGAQFNGVAQRRACAMGFDVVNVGRIDTGARQRLANHLLLGGSAWYGKSAARTVLIDRGPAQ